MTDRLTHEAWSRAVEDGELRGQTCAECGTTRGTPAAACSDCGSRELETVDLPTEGVVYSETTINVPPAGIDARGYQVAVIDLGPTRVLGRLDDEAVEIGDQVAVDGYVTDDDGYVAPRFVAA